MKWPKWVDAIFPYIEPLTDEEEKAQRNWFDKDLDAIKAAKFSKEAERALDEAQRVAAAETERVRTAESKATTYLAVLAALVPLVLTLQAATWEDKSGPAPEGLKLAILFIATVYVGAAGYHAFRTLQVAGFERVVEGEIAAAWRTARPLTKLVRSTLLASRRSREAVNAKVTRIKVTHQHLVRAFGAFVLLLALDPVFYAVDSVRAGSIFGSTTTTEKPMASPKSGSKTPAVSRELDGKPMQLRPTNGVAGSGQLLPPLETAEAEKEKSQETSRP